MANNDKENKIKKFTKEAIGKTLNQFNKEIGIADLVEINKNQDRILNGILSQVNDENTEKTEKSNIITLDNSTDGIVELKEIQGDTNVNVSKIEEMPITHDIGDKEGNVFTLNEIPKGAISIGEIQGNTMVNCNKEADKELILMEDLSTEGYSNVTLTSGVNGGLVDVALEGNTMVNVCDQKDPVAVTLDTSTFTLKYLYPSTEYTIQFESDTGIVIDITLGGTTLSSQTIIVGTNKINITTPSELIDNNLILNGEGFSASNIVVTQATDQDFGYFEGMKSVGECEDLEVVSGNSDSTLSNTQTLTHEPLRAVGDIKDRYVLIDGKWYIERHFDEKVLDGTENFVLDASTQLGDYFVVSTNSLPAINDGNLYVKCDKLPAYYGSIYTTPTRGIYYVQKLKFKLLKSELPSVNIDNFKTWLSNNPIRIVYQLTSPTYEPLDYNPLEVYSDITHISTNSAIPTNITIKNHGYNCLLKPSTTYTISSNLGLNTVTTGADIGDSCLRFYDEDTSDITTMKDVLLLEGDWTSKADLVPNNFSGIESCFEQELVTDENDEHFGKYRVNAKVVGKNLFDGELVLGSLNNSTGNTSNSDLTLRTANFIPVISGSTITLSNDMDYHNYIYEYDGNYNFIKYTGHSSDRGAKTITLNNNTKFIKFRSISGNTENDLSVKYQLEQGDTATEYEPYKENNITFYLNEPLRGTGDIRDRVYIKDDKVIVQRNCGSVILDGSDDEGWVYQDKNNYFNAYLLYKGVCTGDALQTPNLICNRLSTESVVRITNINTHNSGITVKFNMAQNMSELVLSDKKVNLKTYDSSGIKQWLSENPLTVVYQLVEPVYEEVGYSSNRLILDTFNNESFNNSTLFLDTTILPKLSFKPLYEELVYVKNSTKYYIQFNAVGSGEVVINLGGTELTTEIVEGYNCIPITTPSESTNLMTIIGQGITISEVVVSESVCSGHYLGLQSCFEEHMENGKYRVLLRGIALDGSKVNGIKLYINEPLRGIGDIKDRLCIKNGKLMIERKYGEAIFDGSDDENWIKYRISSDVDKYPNVVNCTAFRINILNAKITGYSYIIGNAMCDKLRLSTIDDIFNGYKTEAFAMGSTSSSITIGMSKSLLSEDNITSFKQWLQQNLIKVVYQLAEPTYEEATNEYGLPIVFEGYENGIVYIDSAVTPTTHIKYTSNNQLATTLSEAEEQNIATQEDINMNVITYMMDIDMMLTDMEMSNDISVMTVRRDSSNENMLDRMSDEDKKVYRDNTVVMLEKMITANVLDKEDIEGRIDMYYNKNRISKEQYKYLKSLL